MKSYPLTPQQFTQLRTNLLALGITIPSDSDGQIPFQYMKMNFLLGYHYDGATLSLKIMKKPMFVKADEVWSKVGQWLNGPATV